MKLSNNKTSDNPITDEVPGFSDRFLFLLDRIKFPDKNRYTYGADLFNTTAATFRSWCLNNKPPRRFDVLTNVVEQLVSPLNISSMAVIGWLYTGHPNPFDSSSNDLLIARSVGLIYEFKGVDFIKLSEEDQSEVLKGVINIVRNESAKDDFPGINKNNQKLLDFIGNIIDFKNLT